MKSKTYKFGDFHLNPKFRTLTYREENVPLNPRAFEILLMFVKNPGEIVEKKEILKTVWADSYVEENTLVVHVSTLRKSLKEKDADKKFIETITGRGYVFVAEVFEIEQHGNNSYASDSESNCDAGNTRTEEKAYNFYLRGKYIYEYIANQYNRAESLNQALEWFERAVRVDPDFALAHTWIGNIYCDLFNFNLADYKESFQRTKTAMQIALQINSELADAYILKGKLKMIFESDIPESESAFRRAIQLNPQEPRAHYWQSTACMLQGKFASALALQNEALRLKPASPTYNFGVARILYFTGEYRKSIAQARETLKLDSRGTHCLLILILNYIELELFEDAFAVIEKYREIEISTEIVLLEAYLHAVRGDTKQAVETLDEMLAENYGRQIDDSHVAAVYAALNDADKAFYHLEKAFDSGKGDICFLKIDPRYKNLRRDERFAVLVRELKLD